MRRPDRSLLTGAFVALTLADLAYFAAGGALVAVTPFFVTRSLGLGEAAVGLAVGAFSVTTVVLRPLAGRWADRHGRRPLLVGGAGLFAVLAAGHLLVTDLRGLVALRLLLGAAEALFFVAGFAALADLAPPGRTGEALSYNSLALYGGIATGPVAGQALLARGGFTAVWAGVTALLLVATLLAARVPETLPRERGPAPSAPSAPSRRQRRGSGCRSCTARPSSRPSPWARGWRRPRGSSRSGPFEPTSSTCVPGAWCRSSSAASSSCAASPSPPCRTGSTPGAWPRPPWPRPPSGCSSSPPHEPRGRSCSVRRCSRQVRPS